MRLASAMMNSTTNSRLFERWCGTFSRDSASRDDHQALSFWYGEVHKTFVPTSTDMSNGSFPTRYAQSAYFRNMSYWWDQTHNWWLTTGSLYVTDPNCYDGGGPHYTVSPTGVYNRWRNYFNYGGPGKEAPACR